MKATRSKVMTIRVHHGEHEKVEAAAEMEGLSVNAFVRRAILAEATRVLLRGKDVEERLEEILNRREEH